MRLLAHGRSNRLLFRAAQCGAAALATVACTADFDPIDTTPEPTELTYFGEHIEMGIAEGVTVCGRSSDYADEFVARYLDNSVDGSPSEPIAYYVLTPDAVRSLEICGPEASACAREGVVYSSSAVHLHELVHAVRRLQPDAKAGIGVLEEGIAQLHFTFDLGWDEDFRPSRLGEYIGGGRPSQLYDPAAQLLGIVARETDFATAEELVDASADAMDTATLEAIIDDVVGIEISMLDELYATTPRCSATERSRLLVGCAADPLVWQPGAAPYVEVGDRPLACDDPDVFGPFDDRLWLESTIELPSDATYRLSVNVPPGQTLQLVACDRGCEGGVDVDWDAAMRLDEMNMPAGRYIARLSRGIEDQNAVGFRLSGPS